MASAKRWLLGLLGALIVVAIGAGLFVYVQLDSLVKRAIESYGSDILQAKVDVASVKLSPGDGEGLIEGLRIGAPKGFSADVTKVGKIDLAVNIASLTEDVVRIKRIVVEAPQITYEQGPKGTNLEALQRSVAAQLGETSSAERKSETKLIIDRLSIRGARVTYVPLSGLSSTALTIDLPDITLNNLGKSKGGITGAELTKAVIDALMSRIVSSMGAGTLERGVQQLLGR